MTNINSLKFAIEEDVQALPRGAELVEQAKAALHYGVGVILLRSIRGGFYEAVPIAGSWLRNPWDAPAKTVREVRRDFANSKGNAVGILLPNGAQYVIDPNSRRLVRFIQFVDGSTNR